jgi:hypothetical protein
MSIHEFSLVNVDFRPIIFGKLSGVFWILVKYVK